MRLTAPSTIPGAGGRVVIPQHPVPMAAPTGRSGIQATGGEDSNPVARRGDL